MEKITYAEAREWFWVRTLIWLIPAVLVSGVGHYMYAGGFLPETAVRVKFALGVGAGTAILGLASASMSIQLPWMRSGRWYGFALNGPLCAFMSGFVAFVIFGLVIGSMLDNTLNPPAAQMVDALYNLDLFTIGASGFWGFCFGSWFALRRDRYFVESI